MPYKTWQDETLLELLWNGYELIEKRLDKLEKDLQTAEESQRASPRSRQHGHPLRHSLRWTMASVPELRQIARTKVYYTPYQRLTAHIDFPLEKSWRRGTIQSIRRSLEQISFHAATFCSVFVPLKNA